MKNLILTRSFEENARLFPIILDMGFEPVLMPMIKKTPLDIDISGYDNYQYIVITSKFAATILASKIMLPSKILVVGEESARILSSNPYVEIVGIYENIQEISSILDSSKIVALEKYVYFHGNNITMTLNARMVKIYDTEYFKGRVLDPKSPDNVLIYSEITAEHFILFLKNHNLLQEFKKSVVICISSKVAKKFCDLSENIYCATKPNEIEMLELLKKYGRK